MKKSPMTTKAPMAERLARMADSGKDISRFFTNLKPLQRVNVDFSARMVEELDANPRTRTSAGRP